MPFEMAKERKHVRFTTIGITNSSSFFDYKRNFLTNKMSNKYYDDSYYHYYH